jgi:hypothetical protein
MSILTTALREHVNQKLRDNNAITHNDIEDVLISFYESQGLTDVSIDDDELHDAVTELWADFAQRNRAADH